MNNLRSIFNSRKFLAAVFIVNSSIVIGLTNGSVAASEIATGTLFVGEPVSITYETSSGSQTVMSNEVYFHIQPSPPPKTAQSVEILDDLNPLETSLGAP